MSIEIHDVSVVPEGDGVDVARLFPVAGRMNFDPFVLWDHFDIGPGRGFPDHPHRGFEGITYMFSGSMHHRDNLGNDSVVTAGGAQRFTAGSGIVHSEMPAESGNSSGIQLWVNLPRRLKQIDAAYQQVDDVQFPVTEQQGVKIKTLVGDDSPLSLQTPIRYRHVSMQKGSHYEERFSPQDHLIVYLLKGELKANNEILMASQALFASGESQLVLDAMDDAEFMLCAGRPHGEAIHQHGPFVD